MRQKNEQGNTESSKLAGAQRSEQKSKRGRTIVLTALAGVIIAAGGLAIYSNKAKDAVLNITTFGAYGAYRNDKRARVLYQRFIKAADTDGDGHVSLADQEKYLSEHGIELKSTTLPDGTKAVRNISIFERDYCCWGLKKELDNLEKRLFGEDLK